MIGMKGFSGYQLFLVLLMPTNMKVVPKAKAAFCGIQRTRAKTNIRRRIGNTVSPSVSQF